MEAQHQVLTTLRTSVPRVSALLSERRDLGRNATARRVCEAFGFLDARGRVQQASCLKALRTLDAEGLIDLPAGQHGAPTPKPRVLASPIPEAQDVPGTVGELEELEIVLVTRKTDRAIWNTLMDQEHPRGVTIFAGAQLKYLIKSKNGYLGAVGFSSAALYLKARDQWMAWTHAQRSRQLYRVVNMSRFLIRPSVQCQNLASYVLARVLRRLRHDFKVRYHYVPYLVETFVGPDQEGTCFKAANFRYLGQSKGRGRHAPTNACTRSKKKVFVYELDPRWRRKLDVPHVELRPKLAVGAGLCTDRWAEQEFGQAELGDIRRTARLVKSAHLVASSMGQPVTASPKRDMAAVRGYWRFVEKADEFGITPEKVLAPHRQRTIERMRTQDTVLCVQDGTDISYSTRPECDNLEVIGRNQTTAEAKGVHLHATLAINDVGLPLGVLRCSYRKKGPKTHQWIDGLHDIDAAAQTLPRKTRVISVMDREGDVFAIFAAQQRCKRTDILVRAKHDRRLGPTQARLFKAMRTGPVGGMLSLSVSELSRRAKSGRVTSRGRPGRHARLEVRYRRVTLPPTQDKTAEPVRVSAIHVREIAPPTGAKRLEWYLLTTAEVRSAEEAEQMILYYNLRWRVEDTFRVLKTGCKVEKLRMQQADRLHHAITLHMVTAWRIMLMTLLGRVMADLPAEVLFTETELEVLRVYARTNSLPEQTDLVSAVLLVAMMGGYRNRKHDPPPGHEIMWRGYTGLQIWAVAYEAFGTLYDMVERPPP